jgi:hypothetical protein
MVVKSNELNVGDVIADTPIGIQPHSTILEVVENKGKLKLKYLRGIKSYIMDNGFCNFTIADQEWFLIERQTFNPIQQIKKFSL